MAGKSLKSKKNETPLPLMARIARVLKKQSFRRSEKVVSGTRRGSSGSGTVRLYTQTEGFKLEVEADCLKLTHHLDCSWHEKEKAKIIETNRRYYEILSGDGIKCFLNGYNEVIIDRHA